MPLVVNKEKDLEYTDPISNGFLATWNNLPLTVEFVSKLMDHAYEAGMQRNAEAFNKIVKIVKENTK